MGKELEKAGSKELQANMMGMLAQDSQKHTGFENMTAEDIALPFLTILQALSPQVRGQNKIDGASEGDFYNTVTQEAHKGVLKIIPCAFKKAYVEWTPREQGGGYVKEHVNSQILDSTHKNEKNQDALPNGNIIVTTAYHYVLVVKDNTVERAIISFTSTQLKKSRRWNSQMMNIQIKLPSGELITPPMFSHVYAAKTVSESNDLGQWSGWDISSPMMIDDMKLYVRAKTFSEDIAKGLVKVAPPSPSDEHTAKPPINSEIL